MNAKELADKIRASLHARADQNNDGRLTRADIEVVARQVSTMADAEVRAYPWAAVIVMGIVASLAGYYFRAFVGC